MSKKEILDLATGLAPKVAQVTADVTSRNIGRDSIVRCTMLSLVAGHPAFFLGCLNCFLMVSNVAQSQSAITKKRKEPKSIAFISNEFYL